MCCGHFSFPVCVWSGGVIMYSEHNFLRRRGWTKMWKLEQPRISIDRLEVASCKAKRLLDSGCKKALRTEYHLETFSLLDRHAEDRSWIITCQKKKHEFCRNANPQTPRRFVETMIPGAGVRAKKSKVALRGSNRSIAPLQRCQQKGARLHPKETTYKCRLN